MPAKLTLKDMKNIAQERGGECLSTEYRLSHGKLLWRCAKGHEWEATPNMVRNDNTWCPYCSGKAKHTIEAMRKLAQVQGGECLSKEYINAFEKLRWCCAKGHEWGATASSIKNKGTWCPVCARDVVANKISLDLSEMQELAKVRGGECLSVKYPRGRNGKIRWQCRDGHEWDSTPASVKHSGQWCPICSAGISERLCRSIFEALLEKPFTKNRPSWLRNSSGNSMELDGFNKELGIAFEYHGIQHYKEIRHFHGKTSLAKRIELDEEKRQLCKMHDVTLIEVPYHIEHEKMEQFICQELENNGLDFPRLSPINLNELDYYPKNRLEEMQTFAEAKGGKCLAIRYVTVVTPVRWQCREGHEWNAAFHYIKNKSQWCPECARVRYPVLTIDDMHFLAHSKGGVCLSTQYTKISSKLRWQCHKGHEWEATANDVRNNGSWCPYCAGTARLDLKTMQNMARERGGECLSTEYSNTVSKLHWRCSKGHEWFAAPGTLRHTGSWCPYCAGKIKLTLELMQEIARSRGGECLSDLYINGSTRLVWRCAKGHEWQATPDNVKNGGSWCPICCAKWNPFKKR